VESDERARWDYEQTVAGIRALTEIRFKLLAFIPPLSGAAVALLTGTEVSSGTQGVVGGLGFVVIFGIVVYDQRNSQLYYTLIDRAIWLEGAVLRLPTWEKGHRHGGAYAARPYGVRLFGLFEVSHSRGLALVYAVVLGTWAFPIARVLLSAPGAAAVAGAVAVLFFVELERLQREVRRSRPRRHELTELPHEARSTP
jgi:hypothetical protein